MKNIIWVGTVNHTGIGRAGREYLTLLESHYNIRLCDIDRISNEDFNHLRVNNITGPYTLIVHGLPTSWDDIPFINKLREKAEQTIRLVAWETNLIPIEFEESIKERYDTIIVPSQYSRNAFRDQSNIHIIPHLVKPPRQIIPFNDLMDGYKPNILFIGSQANTRKGIDVIANILSNMILNVNFIIKLATYKDIQLLRTLVTRFPKNVKIITQSLSDQDIWNLYESVDYVLNTSRGEGFGYSYHDPIRVGTPVIGPEVDIEQEQYLWMFPKEMTHYIGYKWTWVLTENSTYEQYRIKFKPDDSIKWIEPEVQNITNIISRLPKQNKELFIAKDPTFEEQIIKSMQEII